MEPSVYTVVGNRQLAKESHIPFSVVVLNRGERIWKDTQFAQLQELDIKDIISVEPPETFYEIENYLERFDTMRFIVPKKEISAGEAINIAISEAHNQWVLVLWNDISIQESSIGAKAIERIKASESLFISPICCKNSNEIIPTAGIPLFYRRNRLKVIYQIFSAKHDKSIFPFDYCGFYNKNKFQSLGGFDAEYKSSYFQLLDFGFRGYMQGLDSTSDLLFRLIYNNTIPVLDTTIDENYVRFYLKNLALHFKKYKKYIPISKFIRFRTHDGLFAKWKKFNLLRKEIDKYQHLVLKSAIQVVKEWDEEKK